MTSNKNIDHSLIEWANKHDISLTDFKARSHNKDLGCFDIETLEVNIPLDKQSLSRVQGAIDILYDKEKKKRFSETEISEAQDIFLKYFQVHSHEYFHLYQTLFLPVAAQLRIVRFNKLKHEAGLIFQCFDQKITFKLSQLNELTDVMDDKYGLRLNDKFIESYNTSLEHYKFYETMWEKELGGISCQHIFEGMAHIASLQLSDAPDIDLSRLKGEEYWKAYDYYESCLSMPDNKQIRFRYLIFLYLCYFSCQVPDHIEDDCSDSIPVQTFRFLCGLSNFFFQCVEKQKSVYVGATQEQLIAVDKWNISEYVIESSSETIASIFALLETIDIISKKTENFRSSRTYSNDSYSDLIGSTKPYGLENDHFLLAKLTIFPLCFSGIYSWSCEAMDMIKGKDGFTLRQEAKFYQFVKNLRNLFKERRRKSIPLYCCAEHGDIYDERLFLTCENQDSCASKIQMMSYREAHNIFQMI